jgi:hypothetical protein
MIGQDLEGSDCGLIVALFEYLIGLTEENRNKP